MMMMLPSADSGIAKKYGYGAAPMYRLLQVREIGSLWSSSQLHAEIQGHGSLVRRLKCESVLNGHGGCVNTLCWNESGSLLASGSDDCKLVVWDYATRKSNLSIQTGHCSNIFAVAFVPSTNDEIFVSGGMDCDIRLHQPPYRSSKVYQFHRGRVKDVKATPAVPFVFWSAGEDGKVIQFDVRDLPESHENTPPMLRATDASSNSSSSGVLIELGRTKRDTALRAMAMAIHPLDPFKMAFACDDEYIRVYDRRSLRYIDEKKSTKPVAMFAPPHLHGMHQKPERHGTSVQYNADGTEILVSYHNDHMYLYNAQRAECDPTGATPDMTYNYVHRCKDEAFDLGAIKDEGNQSYQARKFSTAIELYTKAIELGEKDRDNRDPSILLPLYCNRASALLKRSWRGDVYLSIQDSSRALHLHPSCRKALYRLVKGFKLLGWTKKMKKNARLYRSMFPEHSVDMDRLLNERRNQGASSTDSDSGSHAESDHEEESGSLDEDEDDEVCSSVDPDVEDLVSTHVLRRYIGYVNVQTDIKEARFFGGNDTHIVAGSDSGHAIVWEKHTGKVVNAVEADADIVNCVRCHPHDSVLATSGIENVVRLWAPIGDEDDCCDPEQLEQIVNENQENMRRDYMSGFTSLPDMRTMEALVSRHIRNLQRNEDGEDDQDEDDQAASVPPQCSQS